MVELFCVHWHKVKVGDDLNLALKIVPLIPKTYFVDNKSFYDPVISDLEPHKFSVPTLLQLKHRNQPMIITCDISGVACFRWIGDVNQLKFQKF